ncbi:MAG: hypothetical protein K6T77_06430, partial [candidate division WOR-3 bacterium]|nr:hypothetical protein [candidate division WOR-3 bacterium]
MGHILIIILLNFFPRPEYPAVTTDDIQRLFALKAIYQNVIEQPFEDSSLKNQPEPIPGRFVIGFESGAELNIIRKLYLPSAEVKIIDTSARFLVIETPVDVPLQNIKQQLSGTAGVRFVEPDYPARALFLPNDPMFLSNQWDKWVMYADQAWDVVRGGTVKVAVVDNGVDYTHYDLARNFQANELGYDYVNQDNDPKPDNPNLPRGISWKSLPVAASILALCFQLCLLLLPPPPCSASGDGFCGEARAGAATDWYFAEGYTGPGFQEWVCVFNPEEAWSSLDLKLLYNADRPRTVSFSLAPRSRTTLNINQVAGENREVSLHLHSPLPVVAERPMYFDYRSVCRGGHVSLGVESAGTRWLLAEGTTRPGFHEYLCLLNPGHVDAVVEVDYILGWDETVTKEYTVPARSRFTIEVFRQVPKGRDVSIEVRSREPVVAERPLYFPGAGFEVANAMRHVRDLSVGIGYRVMGTAGEAAAAGYIAATLQGYGYRPAVQEV